MRLEREYWSALEEIARRENRSISEMLTRVDQKRGGASLTASARLFMLSYYRKAATEDGHRAAGHGTLRQARTQHFSDDVLEIEAL